MSSYLPFVVIGLTSGSAYALAALGLVLSYKTSGVFNFSYGAVAMVAAYVYYSLTVSLHFPAALAVLVVLFVVAPLIGLLFDRVVFAKLIHGSTAGRVVGTIGLGLALQGLADIVYGGNAKQVAQFLPTSTVRIFGINIGYDQIIVVAISLVAAVALWAFYRFTRFGLATRALVDNDELAQLEGVRVRRITSGSWAIGCGFAALAGILLVPFVSLDSTILTLLVVQAFGAAAVGRLHSLPLAYAGALLIGIGAALTTKFAATITVLTGAPNAMPFLVLFLVLVLFRKRPQGSAESQHLVTARIPRTGPAELGVGLLIVAVLAVVPTFLSSGLLLGATTTIIFFLLFASLYLVIGLMRQVSLCHVAFAGLGAITLAHLAPHMPFLLALALAALIAVPVAALVSIPAIRLTGLYLALATFGFGLLLQQLVFPTSWGFGGFGVVTVPRPSIGGLEFTGAKSYYYFVLVVVALGIFAVRRISAGRLGRVARALADSEVGVQSLGIQPSVVRVTIFCLSAALASLVGALLGSLYQAGTPTQFDYSLSLLYVAVLVTSGIESLSGAALSAILLGMVPAIFTWQWIITWQPVFFGLNALIYATMPGGIVGSNIFVWQRAKRQVAARWRSTRTEAEPAVITAPDTTSAAVADAARITESPAASSQ